MRAVRGATTLEEDSVEELYKRVQALVAEMLTRNGLQPDDLISMIFTATDDVTAAFPATAARAMGLESVPLLGAREMSVPGDPPRCIRVLAHAYTTRPRGELAHVYLEGAAGLRPDLAR